MISKGAPYLILDDLRGGVNDCDSPVALDDRQLVDCRNVDYRFGQIGSKRGGTTAISLASSVFTRAVPQKILRQVNGWTGASSFSFTVNAAGASSTNQVLIVIVTLSTSSVTGITFGGVALTALDNQTNTNRLEVWYLKNPAITSGSLAITLAGSATGSVVAYRFDGVDTTATITDAKTGNAGSTTILHSVGTLDATSLAVEAIQWVSGTAATLDTVGAIDSVQNLQSTNVEAGAIVKLGMKPTTQFSSTIPSVAWSSILFGLKGVSVASGAQQLVSIMRHEPTNDPLNDELWAQDNQGRLDRWVGGVWQGGVPVQNYQVGSFVTGGYNTNGVSLHGKFFLALEGTKVLDRVHVWDGTVLRHGGFVAPAALASVVDTAGAGSYTTTRYFRYRYTQQVSGITVRRSEPSPTSTFTPAGNKSGAILTLPASGGFLTGEGETHWEIEASVDNANFYRIATQVVGTTTYTDSTAYSTTAYNFGVLSAQTGDYTPMLGVRHVVVDEDRLLGAGSFTSLQSDSRVYWTTLTAEVGDGNDERVPITTRHFLDLDGLYGGRLTMLLPATMGGIVAFKDQRVYKLFRTGRTAKAYDSQMLTPARGALPRAASYGTDEEGQPSIYFWDPNVGLVVFGKNGFVDLMQSRRRLVQRVNKAATNIVRLLFYPKHWLVWAFVALDASTVPNYVICFNVRQSTITDYDGPMGSGVSGVIFKDRTSLEQRPYLAVSTVGTSMLVEADKGVNDDGVYFQGYFTSKAFPIGQNFRNFHAKGAVLHAKAAVGVTIGVTVTRDLGLESKATTASIDPGAGSNTYVTVGIDNAFIRQCNQLQIKIGDPDSYVGAQLAQTWQLDQLTEKFGLDDEVIGV